MKPEPIEQVTMAVQIKVTKTEHEKFVKKATEDGRTLSNWGRFTLVAALKNKTR